jgi:hypothetical protein
MIHDCPMAYIDPTTPKLHGYKSYATFNDSSSEKEVVKSEQSMPMTLYFAICHFCCTLKPTTTTSIWICIIICDISVDYPHICNHDYSNMFIHEFLET